MRESLPRGVSFLATQLFEGSACSLFELPRNVIVVHQSGENALMRPNDQRPLRGEDEKVPAQGLCERCRECARAWMMASKDICKSGDIACRQRDGEDGCNCRLLHNEQQAVMGGLVRARLALTVKISRGV